MCKKCGTGRAEGRREKCSKNAPSEAPSARSGRTDVEKKQTRARPCRKNVRKKQFQHQKCRKNVGKMQTPGGRLSASPQRGRAPSAPAPFVTMCLHFFYMFDAEVAFFRTFNLHGLFLDLHVFHVCLPAPCTGCFGGCMFRPFLSRLPFPLPAVHRSAFFCA